LFKKFHFPCPEPLKIVWWTCSQTGVFRGSSLPQPGIPARIPGIPKQEHRHHGELNHDPSDFHTSEMHNAHALLGGGGPVIYCFCPGPGIFRVQQVNANLPFVNNIPTITPFNTMPTPWIN
jgi:hypothetical protein